MVPGQHSCLSALAELTKPGMWYVPFDPISRKTGLDRKDVRRHVRALARKGAAEFKTGLWSEDGDPRGSGYCITEAGLKMIPEGNTTTQRKGEMINYDEIKVGQKLRITGMGAPGFANLGDIVTVTAIDPSKPRCDVRHDGTLKEAYFALTCGAQRLETVDGIR